jgi:hypothetical protein
MMIWPTANQKCAVKNSSMKYPKQQQLKFLCRKNKSRIALLGNPARHYGRLQRPTRLESTLFVRR